MVYDRVKQRQRFKFIAVLAVLLAVLSVPLKEYFSATPASVLEANQGSVAEGFIYVDAGNGADRVMLSD